MATSSKNTMNSELIDHFIAVTGASRNVAVSLLEACAGNLEMAVGMHMDNDGVGHSIPEETIESDEVDQVRAPIPQKTEVLVDDGSNSSGAWRMRRPRRQVPSVFDGFRDFQSEAFHYDESLRGKKPSKKKSLEDLFRPPIDITYKGTFQSARDAGSTQNKWLLVNVQNVQEFPCQLLNRDVWSNYDARTIIKKNFLFWQVYSDSEEGKRFMQFYKLKQWPYVAVIDPYTGESQIVWTKIADGRVFCELGLSPVPNTSEMSPPAKKLKREPSIIDATEQEQMEAAIQASLIDSQPKQNSPQYVESDSDTDLLRDSDVESFSDSDDIIVSTPPGSSNGHVASKSLDTDTKHSASTSKVTTNSKHERLKQPSAPSTSKPTSLPLVSSQSSSSQLSRVSSNSSDVYLRDSAGPSSSPGQSIWAGPSSGHGSPLEVNIDYSLIDMIGSREAEVCTPDVCTLDDSPSSSQHPFDSSNDKKLEDSLSWKLYWGDSKDPVCKLLMRYPENKREQIELPHSSKLKALVVLCASKGFPADKFELVTNFPRRKLSQMDANTTLKEAGLHPQETVFVQDI